MKERLLVVFNTLKMVETKGESTLVMSDCMRELAKIINSMESEEKDEANK